MGSSRTFLHPGSRALAARPLQRAAAWKVAALWGLLALGIGLNSLPLGRSFSYLWPDWAFLILAYWALVLPHRCGVGTAWVAGLFQDGVTGTLLGLNALIYVVSLHLLIQKHRSVRLLPLGAQSGLILLLALSGTLVRLWIEGPMADLVTNLWALLPALITALLWSPVFIVLHRLHRHLGSQ